MTTEHDFHPQSWNLPDVRSSIRNRTALNAAAFGFAAASAWTWMKPAMPTDIHQCIPVPSNGNRRRIMAFHLRAYKTAAFKRNVFISILTCSCRFRPHAPARPTLPVVAPRRFATEAQQKNEAQVGDRPDTCLADGLVKQTMADRTAFDEDAVRSAIVGTRGLIQTRCAQ